VNHDVDDTALQLPAGWAELSKSERRQARRAMAEAAGFRSVDGRKFTKGRPRVDVSAAVTATRSSVTVRASSPRALRSAVASGAIATVVRVAEDSMAASRRWQREVAAQAEARYNRARVASQRRVAARPKPRSAQTIAREAQLRERLRHELLTDDFPVLARRVGAIAKSCGLAAEVGTRILAELEHLDPTFGQRARRLRKFAPNRTIVRI